MKKIFLSLFVILITCQTCFADINVDKATDSEKKLDNKEIKSSETILNVNNHEPDNIFTNDPQTSSELQGYLEYDETPNDTIYLKEQVESSQNTIYLKSPSNVNSLKLKAPAKVGTKSLISTSIKKIPMSEVDSLDAASKFSTQEYNISPINGDYTIKSGGMSFGTVYNSDIDGAQSVYSTGVFTKYEGNHFAVKAGFTKNTKSAYSSYSDKIFFAPELKLTKRLSILDVIQTDMQQINKKNEVVLRYTPSIKKHADDVQFEVGAGQYFYENNYINSSVRFSTRFKL